jgi:hypothetical protein
VLNNPYFATTSEDGLGVITDIPDGEYTLRTWTRLGGEAKQPISFSGGKLSRVHLKLKEDSRKRRPHSNKFGKRYRTKY